MLLKTDDLGIPRFTNRDLINMIYSGHIDKCHVVLCDPSDDIDRFNKAAADLGLDKLNTYIPIDVDQKTFDGACQGEYYMPDDYKMSNPWLKTYLIELCETPEEEIRVLEEYDEFKQRGMLDLIKYMIYLVDFMKENNIVWGVGRGSSVASFILYKIGVHKVDSLKHGLDWKEFLR